MYICIHVEKNVFINYVNIEKKIITPGEKNDLKVF